MNVQGVTVLEAYVNIIMIQFAYESSETGT